MRLLVKHGCCRERGEDSLRLSHVEIICRERKAKLNGMEEREEAGEQMTHLGSELDERYEIIRVPMLLEKRYDVAGRVAGEIFVWH
jgi:hypothetical protein